MVFEDLIIDRVLDGVFRNAEGAVIGGLNQIQDLSINATSETKDKTDANGVLIKRFYTAKNVEVSAQNAVFSLSLLALQAGDEKLVASAQNKLVVPRIMKVAAADSPVTLPEAPIAGTLSVTGLKTTGAPDSALAYEADTEAGAGKYALSGTTLTLPTDATDKVQIVYMYEAEKATKVIETSGKFPKTSELILSVLVCDACDTETLRHAYIVFPSFQMSPDFDLSIATDATHPFSGIAQVDYCGGEQQLFYIAVSEDDVEE